MKTPEEIKNGLECCTPKWMGNHWKSCSSKCPYITLAASCRGQLAYDALVYIQQLEMREWDLFDLITSAWFGKRCYFQQDDGTVYSRASGEYMSFDQAIDEFAHDLTCDRECAQAGKDTNVPSWISVEERLPQDNADVLVHAIGNNENSVVAMTSYTHNLHGYNIEGWRSPWQYFFHEYKITHWMPLPEPPKED